MIFIAANGYWGFLAIFTALCVATKVLLWVGCRRTYNWIRDGGIRAAAYSAFFFGALLWSKCPSPWEIAKTCWGLIVSGMCHLWNIAVGIWAALFSWIPTTVFDRFVVRFRRAEVPEADEEMDIANDSAETGN